MPISNDNFALNFHFKNSVIENAIFGKSFFWYLFFIIFNGWIEFIKIFCTFSSISLADDKQNHVAKGRG